MVINRDHSAPMGTIPGLRLHIVKRWAIVKMKREQSVAEHSYNVATIVEKLFTMFPPDDAHMNDLMAEAIRHDRDEIFTGDVPSPAKQDSRPCNHHPLVKLADLIETLVFFVCNNDDSLEMDRWVVYNLHMTIERHCKSHGYDHNKVSALVQGISI